MTFLPWKGVRALSLIMFASLVLSAAVAASADTSFASPITVSVNAFFGTYRVSDARSGWSFDGTTGALLTRIKTQNGSDRFGRYSETAFDWRLADGPITGTIRVYQERRAIRWWVATPLALTHGTPQFPNFTALPPKLHVLSFNDTAFSPPTFTVASTATPVLLFDDRAENSVVISPASDFFVSRMFGDGVTSLASGLNTRLGSVPAGFSHSTLMVFGNGIKAAFDVWGQDFNSLVMRTRPASDADILLKYLGYWTDNGAYYYYHYDKGRGYAGTLSALVDHYKEAGIPLRYLQLDSWWYQKTRTGLNGKEGSPKAADLPAGTWNAYGGTTEYRASPDLFPDGLSAFHQKIDLPLVVHGRWIDPASPYHAAYRISGVAPIDPEWWDETATYLNRSGVVCYEQDWLSEIYNHTPEMHSSLDAGPAFADNMARAALSQDETLQYCMATPRFFLNGARYNNLTTIRVSDDRFDRSKWDPFLYTSEFANALGIWPWVDVFKSTETGNILLATLSAGPVGVGDKIGQESKENILRAVRGDGRIVKPDAPVLPTDETILADARGAHRPVVAWTYTDHGADRTAYVVAYSRASDLPDLAPSYVPAATGVRSSRVYIYDYFARTGQVVDASRPFEAIPSAEADNLAYNIVAPVGDTGIAMLGDLNQFVSVGRQRVPDVTDRNGKLTVTAVFAPTEKSVTLSGYAPVKPHIDATEGSLEAFEFDPATRRFTATLSPGDQPRFRPLDGDPVFWATVVLTPGQAP